MKLFLVGIFMGIADLIPGVSGGTVAFISGVYERFLQAIKSFNLRAFYYLLTFQMGKFKENTDIRFLLILFSGILTAIILFSKLIGFLLADVLYSVYLLSFFLGIITASIKQFKKQVIKWKFSTLLFLLSGILFSFSLVYFSANTRSHFELISPVDYRVITAGFFAVLAMLLPGISGSFVLLLLGMYTPMIQALSNLTNEHAFCFLINLGMGIVLGFVFFSRLILFLLNAHKRWMIASLLGFMLGSVYAIWPYSKNPSLTNQQIAFTLCYILAGYMAFNFLQKKRDKKALHFID